MILTILGIGEIKEFELGIKYPAQAAVNLTKYEGPLIKEQIYNKLEQLVKANNLTFFKPIWQSDGSQKVFVFGNSENYFKNKMYSNDKNLLSDASMTGMYYCNKHLGKIMKNDLLKMGFKYKGGDIGWWMMPFNFFLGRNVRSAAVWTLLFVFAVLLFAVKMIYVKTAMVKRSLGMFRLFMQKDIMIDIGILIFESIGIIIVFALLQKSMTSVFVKTFSLLVGVILLCLLIISLIVNGLFALNVRFMPAVKVLKNKKSQGIISYIWLLGILASIFIFGLTASEIAHVAKALAEDAKVLQKWEVAKNFATITWFDKTVEHMDENHMIDRQFMLENGRKNKKFIKSFKKEDLIYAKASELGMSNSSKTPKGFIQELANADVDVNLAKSIQYVNEGLIDKNKKLYPHNTYGHLSLLEQASPVILYVPKKYESSIEAIKKIIHFEKFQYTSIDVAKASIVVIPNRQKTFLFRHIEGENELLAKQEGKDKILVELNFAAFPDEDALTQSFDIIAFNTLFNQKQIIQNIKRTGLEDTFSSLTNVSGDMMMKQSNILSQLTGSVIALISLTIAQLFVLYQYIKLQIESKAKQITVLSLLGQSITVKIVQMLALLTGGILLISRLAYLVTKNKTVIAIVLFIYLIETQILAIFAWMEIKHKRVQVMKGDFEIL
jgi:hypothetical protein